MSVALALSLRSRWLPKLLKRCAAKGPREFEVLEVMIDDYLHPSKERRQVRRLGTRWPLIAHGVNLGIGDAAGLNTHYVNHVHDALRALAVRWWSDHLCFLRAGNVDLGHFGPVDNSLEAREVVARNVQQAIDLSPCPFLLENISDIVGLGINEESGGALGEAFGAMIEGPNIGMLLDLTNLYIDAENGGWDPIAYLDALPKERIVEVHLAGSMKRHGLWIDSHSERIHSEALELLRYIAPKAPNLRAVTLEWDMNIPPLEVALEELRRAGNVLEEVGRR